MAWQEAWTTRQIVATMTNIKWRRSVTAVKMTIEVGTFLVSFRERRVEEKGDLTLGWSPCRCSHLPLAPGPLAAGLLSVGFLAGCGGAGGYRGSNFPDPIGVTLDSEFGGPPPTA